MPEIALVLRSRRRAISSWCHSSSPVEITSAIRCSPPVRQGIRCRHFHAQTPTLSEPLFLEVRAPPPNRQNSSPPPVPFLPLYSRVRELLPPAALAQGWRTIL